MKRREFLLATLVGPFIPIPKPTTFIYPDLYYKRKYKGAKQGPTHWTSADPKYPKMDRFVNDHIVLPDKAGPFWLRPCSHVGCGKPRDYWLHNG